MSSPAVMVLHVPASSAGRKRTLGSFEEAFANGLQLMRQRVHARDGKPDVGIEFASDANAQQCDLWHGFID